MLDNESRWPVGLFVFSEQLKFVPRFDEDHVAEIFQRSEKIAKGCG